MSILYYDRPDSAIRKQLIADLETSMASLKYRLTLHADELVEIVLRLIDHDPEDVFLTLVDMESELSKVKLIAKEMLGNLRDRDGL